MRSERSRLLKERPTVELPPRAFRELIDPIKAARYQSRDVIPSYFYRSGVSFQDADSQLSCIGHFWDNDKKRVVRVDLGVVIARVPFVYRAAPSAAAISEQETRLSGSEGAARSANDFFRPAEHRTERSEGVAQAGEKKSGSYVIPGQSAMGGIKC